MKIVKIIDRRIKSPDPRKRDWRGNPIGIPIKGRPKNSWAIIYGRIKTNKPSAPAKELESLDKKSCTYAKSKRH